MTGQVEILATGPGVTVQDRGRPGLLGQGISASGAADPVALAEGAALLGQSGDLAALEMAGMGATLCASRDLRIALTGAPMAASVDGRALAWNMSHRIAAGAVLTLGGTRGGVYGYLSVGGGLDVPPLLGSRATHASAGLGHALAAGECLPLGPDTGNRVGLTLDPLERWGGGCLRIVPSLQTGLFAAADLARFEADTFTRDPRGNRMGVRLTPQGAPYAIADQRTILSDVIVPGDIQMTGDGVPFVLLNDCQTTGGYPRIGTVLPCDLPRVAQAAPGARLRFAFVTAQQGRAALRAHAQMLADLPRRVRPALRDPRDIADLLGYSLVSGVMSAAPDWDQTGERP